MENIPNDVLILIGLQLDLTSLGRYFSLNRRFNLLNSDKFWRLKFINDFADDNIYRNYLSVYRSKYIKYLEDKVERIDHKSIYRQNTEYQSNKSRIGSLRGRVTNLEDQIGDLEGQIRNLREDQSRIKNNYQDTIDKSVNRMKIMDRTIDRLKILSLMELWTPRYFEYPIEVTLYDILVKCSYPSKVKNNTNYLNLILNVVPTEFHKLLLNPGSLLCLRNKQRLPYYLFVGSKRIVKSLIFRISNAYYPDLYQVYRNCFPKRGIEIYPKFKSNNTLKIDDVID